VGGALSIRLAASGLLPVIGCLCVDLVEGSAVASLEHMRAAVAARPPAFPSLAAAIEWAVRAAVVLNPESARVSIPPQLVASAPPPRSSSAAAEPPPEAASWRWRTDLLASEVYWSGWYSGLSSLFLSLRCPKLLLLASVDRLDREMSVGQMQGKLQVEVVRGCGHAVQEDQPRETARLMLDWMRRQQMQRRGRMLMAGNEAAAGALVI
jgi:protein phosphatase methylesterase 1